MYQQKWLSVCVVDGEVEERKREERGRRKEGEKGERKGGGREKRWRERGETKVREGERKGEVRGVIM